MSTEWRWGLITGAATILYLLLEWALGIHDPAAPEEQTWSTFIAVLIPTLGITMGIREKRNCNPRGELSYGKGFLTGIWITLIVAGISVLFQLLYHLVLNPGYLEEARAVAAERIDSEQVMAMGDWFFTLESYLLQTLVGTLVTGLIISLIAAAVFMRKHDDSLGDSFTEPEGGRAVNEVD